MTPLHVLVYGPLTGGACNVYRFGILQEALARHGVEIRSFSGGVLTVPERDAGSPEQAFASPDLTVDRAELDWADVIVFRRFYTTHWTCLDCAFVGEEGPGREHALSVGHELCEPDRLIRPLFGALDDYPEILRGRAVVYETDDDLFDIQPWNGMRNRVGPELDMIERMLRRADLVTVSTPVLRTRLARYNDEIRVLRNAVNPAWYRMPDDAGPVEGTPRLLYYGSPARFRDYEVCRPAVDEIVRTTPGARRVWLGALNARAGGAPARILAAVDETGPFVLDPQAFAGTLAASRPDIGLAPLVGDRFDQAKSELHWLEYTMAGAVTVATRMRDDGPYNPIRHGVDGLLARTRSEWLDHLRRLAASPAMREDIAARARERVLAEYTVEVRAAEWADAYRWAAEHAGRLRQGRVHGLGQLPPSEIEAHGRASLGHRLAARAWADEAPGVLHAARGDRASCGPATTGPALVSVVVPVVDEPVAAVRRAVRSALAGTHRHLEVVVAIDLAWPSEGFRELGAAAEALDTRVRLVRVDAAAGEALPPAAEPGRAARRGRVLAAGVAEAAGEWIAPLAPDAAFTADHVEVLLDIAQEHELEFVYGQAQVVAPGELPLTLGVWPPAADEVMTLATELFAAPLLRAVPLDPDAWRDGETTAWAFWRSSLEAGARAAGIEYPVASVTPLDADEADPSAVRAVA